MSKHRIKLRRADFSSQMIEKHKNYGQLLEQHRRANKHRVGNYFIGLIILGAAIALIYYTMERIENITLPVESTPGNKEEIIRNVEPLINEPETSPQPQGGLTAYFKYLEAQVTYPQAARDAGVEGIVYIAFVVETDGTITQLRVLKGLGYGCDELAMEAVRNGPSWIPGTERDEQVRAPMVIPVAFKKNKQ